MYSSVHEIHELRDHSKIIFCGGRGFFKIFISHIWVPPFEDQPNLGASLMVWQNLGIPPNNVLKTSLYVFYGLI